MKTYNCVPFYDTEITGGFWAAKQKLLNDVTLEAVYKRFEEDGKIAAFECKKGSKTHIFWDSDVAKWIEAASYVLEKKEDKGLEERIDAIVDNIEKHMTKDGYFNSYYIINGVKSRFTKRDDHELYCAGHLMEAACAYFHATGKDKFLKLMSKYADLIYKVFYVENSAAFATCGHPEIEMALIKLSDATGDLKYLELAKYFCEERGEHDSKDERNYYDQTYDYIRTQNAPEGHAVRQMYFSTALARIAKIYDESSIYEVCERLFNCLSAFKYYITGGIGSSYVGEAFTENYDLPNKTAYAETCAAIGEMMFLRGMSEIDADARYADLLERVMYNGFMSGLSLDGNKFFYTNPLEIDPVFANRNKRAAQYNIITDTEYHPLTQRVENFQCSCCPPNIARTIASIADYIYMYDNETIFLNHYMDSKSTLLNGKGEIKLVQKTNYPADGKVSLTVSGAKGMKIKLRIPSWCEKYSVNGTEYTERERRAYFTVDIEQDEQTVELELYMTPVLMEANPNVKDDCGKVALMYGPVVYCLEAVDNGPMLNNIMVDPEGEFKVEYNEEFGLNTISGEGFARDTAGFPLYRKFRKDCLVAKQIKFVPYSVFANRGESEMIVWVRVKY